MSLNDMTWIKIFIVCIGIIIGFMRFTFFNESTRIFWLFLFVALVFEIMDPLMSKYFGINFLVYHMFRPLLYVFLTVALSLELSRFKKIYLASIPVVLIAAFLNGYYFQPPDVALNTIIINLISVLSILQVLFYIAILFEEHSWNETMYYYSFWIAMATLLHSIASFLSLGIHNLLKEDGQAVVVWVQAWSEFVFYGAFSVNFLMQKKRQV